MPFNLNPLSKQQLKKDFKEWEISTNFKEDKGYIFGKTFIYSYDGQEEDEILEIVSSALNFTWKKQKKGVLLSTRFLPFLKFDDVKLKWIIAPSKYRRPTVTIHEDILISEIHIDHHLGLLGFWKMLSVICWLLIVFIFTAILISFIWKFGLQQF